MAQLHVSTKSVTLRENHAGVVYCWGTTAGGRPSHHLEEFIEDYVYGRDTRENYEKCFP